VKVNELMTPNVRICRPEDQLDTAAQIMWDNNCGCVPVVDENLKLVGVITDRDICMAAYLQGKELSGLTVSSAMSHRPVSCRPGDEVAAAEKLLRDNQVRRLPVTDPEGKVIGVLSIDDLALEAARRRAAGRPPELTDSEIAHTFAAVSQPRTRGIGIHA
jgi:CBS domain-containing protein